MIAGINELQMVIETARGSLVGWARCGVVLPIGWAVWLTLVVACRPVPAEQPLDTADLAVGELEVDSWIETVIGDVLADYVHLHQHPELSFHERETAQFLAKRWRTYGYDVTEQVGGWGVVGIMENGDGPTVMLRADMDALPVKEATGLPFASEKVFTGEDGATVGVMHACGHDVHMANLLGVAKILAEHRDRWQGRLMLVGQPAEERGAGARAMLQDGLFDRFGRPDFAIALHCESETETGKVALSPGFSLANVDSVDIIVRGRGGHGSRPETTVDPIVQAADLILDLQTIVSREIKPQEPAVITVGAIHGGTKHNVIGDACHLQLTVRSYSEEVRQQLLSAIRRKALAVAQSHRAPAPEILVSEGTPALRNDPELTARLTKVFSQVLGKDAVLPMPPVMGGEDFSRYGLAGVPIVMYRLGVVAPDRLQGYRQRGLQPPSLHSPQFYPDAEPALRTGMKTMTAAVLDLLARQSHQD
ncbi:MAG: hippurate hydrolase [Pirellulaceae bacterium]|nr:MAG: hippurate hydrolase [Pirellulaceae bacterium]